jgi:haloalkane dehalogenase
MNKKVEIIFNKKMSFYDEGKGESLVFIHGNPTSSYLWRNIAPEFTDNFRVIVPDLIGMGDSDKLDGIDNIDYNFNGQYKYLDKLLSKLVLGDKIHLVIHDWGCGLGLKYARLNAEKIKSISFMEGMVIPLTWEEWPDGGTKIFELFRSEVGESLILEKNYFVERILFNDPISEMSNETKNEYLRPFAEAGEGRRPTLTFPRNIPLDTKPDDTYNEILLNENFHKESNIPKLFINAEPGFLLVGSQRDKIRKWSNLKEVTVKGNHFIQEDSPQAITESLKAFYQNLKMLNN